MGKAFLYGKTLEKDITDLFAKLTVYCSEGMIVQAKSLSTSLTFETTANMNGAAVFKNITAGYWDITILNIDDAPVKRVRIDNLDYTVSFDELSATIDIIFPSGSVCTVTNGTDTYTAPDTSGIWACVVNDTGVWTVSATDGEYEASTQVNVSSDGEIVRVELKYFAATINIAYPEGSVCTVSDGTTTYTAPDTSGVWTCTVSNVGTWTICSTKDDLSVSNAVSIIVDGQYFDIILKYFEATISITYPEGSICTVTNGSKSYTAPDTTGSWNCVVNSAGDWTVTSVNGEESASNTVTIYEDDEVVTVELKYVVATITVTYPSGSVCTITSGSKVYNAPNTSGSWSCSVVGSGEWTVTATDGEQSDSKTVNVVYNGQISAVVLKYFGATINVEYPEGSTCTISNGTKTYTASDTSGIWNCIVNSTGEWTVTSTDGTQTDSIVVTIDSDGEIAYVTLAYFEATVTITYPSGSTCTLTNGSETYTAPDTSGTWTCVLDISGTWTASCTDGERTDSSTINLTTNGQSVSVTLKYFGATINIAYTKGYTCTCSYGDTTYTAPDTSGTWACVVPNVGTWLVYVTGDGFNKTATVTITQDEQVEEVTLKFVAYIAVTYPEGSTCTCYMDDESYTASDTTGSYTFAIPYAGEWTVECQNSSGKVSNDVVEITTDGQEETVELEYVRYLYKEGNEYTSYTGGWQARGITVTTNYAALAPTLTKNDTYMNVQFNTSSKASGCIDIVNDVDVSDYTTLYVEYDSSNTTTEDNGYLHVEVYVVERDADEYYYDCAAYVAVSSTTDKSTISTDISSLSGDYTVAFSMRNKTSGYTASFNCDIYRVWME